MIQGFRYLRDGQDDIALEIWGILATLSLSYSPGIFCRTFQEAGVAHSVGFCPSGIGLIVVVVFEEPGRIDQLTLSLLAARPFSLDGKASLVVSDAWRPSEGSEEASKRGCELGELMSELIVGGPSMVAKGNQNGRVR